MPQADNKGEKARANSWHGQLGDLGCVGRPNNLRGNKGEDGIERSRGHHIDEIAIEEE